MAETIKDKIRKIILKYINSCFKNYSLQDEFLYLDDIIGFIYYIHSSKDDCLDMNVLQCLKDDGKGLKEELLSREDNDCLVNNYIETIECCMELSEGHFEGNGAFYQPREFTRMICNEVPQDVNIVYNPFAGLNHIALELTNSYIVGDELSKKKWAYGQIRLFVNGVKASIKHINSLNINKNEEKYDAIVCIPPVASKELPIDNIIISLIEKLNENGTLVFPIPTHLLYSERYKQFRNKLIDSNLISKIIYLENLHFFLPTQSSIIVLRKSINTQIKFVVSKESKYNELIFEGTDLKYEISNKDGENIIEVYVGYDKISGYSNILNPYYYCLNLPLDCIEFSEIASVLRPRRTNFEGSVNAISVKDLSANFPRQAINCGSDVIDKRNKYYVKSNCILCMFLGDKFLVGYTHSNEENIFVSRHDMFAIYPNDGYSMDYVLAVLLQKNLIRQILLLAPYVVIPNSALCNVRIPNIPEAQRDKLITEVALASMTDMEKRLDSAYKEYQKEIHSRKHAIGQTISSMSALWNRFERYRKSHGDIINLNDNIGNNNKISIHNLFELISYKIDTIICQTENLADVEYNWGESEIFDVGEFIKTYIDTHFDNNFHFSFYPGEFLHVNAGEEVDWNGNIQKLDKSSCIFRFYFYNIEMPKKALERVFDNIISNAVSHGFEGRDDNNIISINYYSEANNVIIEISNNGKPLDEFSNSDNILTYGYSTALNIKNVDSGACHYGIGGYDIKTILTKFGGFVSVISTPSEEFTVTYKMSFPIINNEQE